jgi:signal peptidase I
MLWLMKVSTLLRTISAVTAFFLVAAGRASVVERPLSSVSLTTTVNDASKVAARHGDMQVLRIEGDSMLPFFGSGSVVIVKKIDASQLRPGMVVVYQNRFGDTVAHRLVEQAAAGWIAQGYNNSVADTTAVSNENLIGVVYATFHSNGHADPFSGLASLVGRTQVALAAPAK